MKIFKHLFHFFGGIQFAIALIIIAALTVITGTLLESQTGSHLYAVSWTYGHPFFIVLLAFFFINILFSALRRWPFKKRHIPFLITHIGLLMIISGTIIKNLIGLQGHLLLWEGSGNQEVILPHTHAIWIESKENQKSLIPLSSFKPAIYYPFHFPQLKCKMIAYAPHVVEKLESWMKDQTAYVSGFPPIPIHTWDPSESFPRGKDYYRNGESLWSLLAIRSHTAKEALLHAYLQDLDLLIKNSDASLQIPLKKALQGPIPFSEGLLFTTLKLEGTSSSLDFRWGKRELHIPLQGEQALIADSPHPFKVDLKRPHPALCLIEDNEGTTHLSTFDPYGRIHIEQFNSEQLQSLVSYNQGFDGYGVQAIIPFPSFPCSRQDKEQVYAHALTLQLQEAMAQNTDLAPPLRLLDQACKLTGEKSAPAFIQFLMEWNDGTSLLYRPTSLPPSLERILAQLNWKDVSEKDQQATLWAAHLMTRLEEDQKNGKDITPILKRDPLDVVQQIPAIVANLPPLELSDSLSPQEQATLLSAFFRLYGIDYPSLLPPKKGDKESFDALEAYWKGQNPSLKIERELILETPLSHRLQPEEPPLKLEDHRPGIVLEVQQGEQKQTIALAYDPNGSGLKWPILYGSYLARLQPNQKELPYRLRLRQARQIPYPHSSQTYSYEGDILITEKGKEPIAQTLSMNHVYETWDGYRFYLSGIAHSSESGIKRIQLAVNHDPAKYLLTYPGAALVFTGILLLFWLLPYRKNSL